MPETPEEKHARIMKMIQGMTTAEKEKTEPSHEGSVQMAVKQQEEKHKKMGLINLLRNRSKQIEEAAGE